MGQFNFKPKQITINEENQFILAQYVKTLVKMGLIEVKEAQESVPATINPTEKKYFDANLLPSVKQKKTGLLNALIQKVETVSSSSYGAQFATLELMQITVDNDLDEIFQVYVNEWSIKLTQTGISPKELDSTEIEKPEILIARIPPIIPPNIL